MNLSKKELQERANDSFFKKQPSLTAIIGCSDGNFFYPEHANSARAHAGKTLKLHVLERPGGVKSDGGSSKQKEYATASKGVIKELNAAKSATELGALHEKHDLSNEERKTVLEAYKKGLEKYGGATNPESTKTGTGAPAPQTPEELIAAIEGVETEQQLDELEAAHNLSKHADQKVVSAFEAKESKFLD